LCSLTIPHPSLPKETQVSRVCAEPGYSEWLVMYELRRGGCAALLRERERPRPHTPPPMSRVARARASPFGVGGSCARECAPRYANR